MTFPSLSFTTAWGLLAGHSLDVPTWYGMLAL